MLYLSCEDRTDELHLRLARICDHFAVDMTTLHDRLSILDLVDQQTGLARPAHRGGLLAPTDTYKHVSSLMRQHDVLIADSLSDVFEGDENDRAHVKQFFRLLLRLIDPRRGALLILAHVNKRTATKNQTNEAYSGSTQWHNAVRSRWYLTREADGRRVLKRQKNNYGPDDEKSEIAFQWSDAAEMFVGEDASAQVSREQDERERDDAAVLAALRKCAAAGNHVPAARQSTRTGYHVLRETGLLPESMSGNDKRHRERFWAVVDRLLKAGEIETGAQTVQGHKISVLLFGGRQSNGG